MVIFFPQTHLQYWTTFAASMAQINIKDNKNKDFIKDIFTDTNRLSIVKLFVDQENKQIHIHFRRTIEQRDDLYVVELILQKIFEFHFHLLRHLDSHD
jgi:hypothetical protein